MNMSFPLFLLLYKGAVAVREQSRDSPGIAGAPQEALSAAEAS